MTIDPTTKVAIADYQRERARGEALTIRRHDPVPGSSAIPNGEEAPPPSGFEDYGYTEHDGEDGEGEVPEEQLPPLRIVSPSTFVGSPPPRQWIVPNWIPCGVVTGLYGDGGLGKSLLGQQLQTGSALGSTWIGLPIVEPIPSLGMYCEDSEDELLRRQDDINASYRCDRKDIHLAAWMPRDDCDDNLLMTFSRNGLGERTKFYWRLREAALDLKARLVIIDPADEVFGGNEIIRREVRQFVRRGLGSLARDIAGAVVLVAHPSQVGLRSGEGTSGSTGWSNAFRSRLYFRMPASDGDAPIDPNARIIERKKANYSSRGDELKLHYANGVIEPEAKLATAGASSLGRRSAEDVFLALLDTCAAEGQRVSGSFNAQNYAPKLFVRRPEREGYTRREFENAMRALFKNHAIRLVPYGRKGDEHYRIERSRKEDEP